MVYHNNNHAQGLAVPYSPLEAAINKETPIYTGLRQVDDRIDRMITPAVELSNYALQGMQQLVLDFSSIYMGNTQNNKKDKPKGL